MGVCECVYVCVCVCARVFCLFAFLRCRKHTGTEQDSHIAGTLFMPQTVANYLINPFHPKGPFLAPKLPSFS